MEGCRDGFEGGVDDGLGKGAEEGEIGDVEEDPELEEGMPC